MDIKKYRLFIFGLPKTLRFNFYYFPFKTAIKLPVLLTNRVRLKKMKGKVTIDSQKIKRGMVLLIKKIIKSFFFTIVDKNNNVLGYTQLLNINWINRNCYFGIIIGDTENRGKGIGKEVMELMIGYAFKILNLRKILLEVLSTNTNAIKLYENLGFVSEGVLKEHAFIKGVYHDVIIMAKIKKI